jgi:U32 family peptidase
VFVHGALCYSFSGMCMASSFFGGASGNRGRCTQVCRRSFATNNKTENGYFFSPNDFWAIQSVSDLIRAGVKSFKIEGRMKSAQYVHTVVSAYRMTIDDPQKCAKATELLRRDLGRRKTRLFLDGVTQSMIIDASQPGGTGTFIGTIATIDKKEMSIVSNEKLRYGDLLRAQPQDGSEGMMASVVSSWNHDGILQIMLDKELACETGASVYFVGSADKLGKVPDRLPGTPAAYSERFSGVKDLIYDAQGEKKEDPNRDRRLFIKVDDYRWLSLLTDKLIGGVICAFDRSDIETLKNDSETRTRFGRAAYIEPPPFIAEAELGAWRTIVQELCVEGECGLMCQNIGHVALVNNLKRLRSDFLLWSLNRVAQAAYSGLGIKQTTHSLEDDNMNLRDCISQNEAVYLFTHAPLFVSRMKPGIGHKAVATDRENRSVRVFEKYGLYYLVAEETMSLFHKREKMESYGARSFVIDLSFMEPDSAVLAELLGNYSTNTKFAGSCLFNFKGGLM